MAIRQIQTEYVRAHTLSDRGVRCPGAMDHDTQSRYTAVAKTGRWITYRETDAAGAVFMYRCGRVLGRVEAGPVQGPDPTPAIDGYISVLALSDTMQYAYIRWVNPDDVAEVSSTTPAALLAWITGVLPDADLVHKLSHYGTLSASYIHLADHHVNAWQHGVSPAAWDRGVRGICPICKSGCFDTKYDVYCSKACSIDAERNS